jgi:alanine racemase
MSQNQSPDKRLSTAFHRPCWVEIDTAALRRNFQTIRNITGPSSKILAVVKANAYGHGIIEISRIMAEEGAQYLGVTSIEEGMALRRASINLPILVLGSLYPFDSFPLLFEYRLTPTIASIEGAKALSDLAIRLNKNIAVHLKFDSGFGRIGVSTAGAAAFLEKIRTLPGLIIEGLYTHFSDSDGPSEYTFSQISRFKTVLQAAQSMGLSIPLVHMANSAAILRFPEALGTMARPGISLYGAIAPSISGSSSFRAVLCWKTRIIFIKSVPEGASISYNCTWTAKRPTRVATLAVGYADGFPRSLSNKGWVLIHGRRVPVIGRVTMDMTMVDVTDVKDCHVGDDVTLIGTQESGEISANEVAEWTGTIPYEILCGIAPRVYRIYL